MKTNKIAEYIKIDKLDEAIRNIKAITNEMDNSFWFQDKFINNICFCLMLPIWKILGKKDPRTKYCQKLVCEIFKINDKKILFSKELNLLIHGPWISHGYFGLTIIPSYIDEFHAFLNRVDKMNDIYQHNVKIVLKNNKKWNTIISKKGYFIYK